MRVARSVPVPRRAVDAENSEFAHALVAGLRAVPRRVPPRWFYDRRGSELFERICELPEYYPTRTEVGLLEQHGPAIARAIGSKALLLDFGGGSLRKMRSLMEHLRAPAAYCPVDVSADFLHESAAQWRREFPSVRIEPIVADFTVDFPLHAATEELRTVGFFPGSSIGNLEPDDARAWLRRMRDRLPGGLLVGVDLVKNPAVLRAAYNDAAGVTAAFNLNLWARANREAAADFVLDQWRHLAFYNSTRQRIEMHLVSRRRQRVGVAGTTFDFAAGDAVHTENSYKYSVESFQALANAAGWEAVDVWSDRQQQFSLHWLRPSVREAGG